MSSQREESPPLELPSDTLALLQQFQQEQSSAEDERKALEERMAKASDVDQPGQQPVISVAEFRRLFGEDWQKSQFWYSEQFAYTFARSLLRQIRNPSTNIIFVSCPTAYVAFTDELSRAGPKFTKASRANTYLFEFDQRFETFAKSRYVHYNLFDPTRVLPAQLMGSVDVAVVDPPFLNLDTNAHVVETLKLLLKKDAQVVLLSSLQVQDIVEGPKGVYKDCGQGPLTLTPITVEHAGGLANHFAVWSNRPDAKTWNI